MRDHEPKVIDSFRGLWRRGSKLSCPIDHFTDCNNILFTDDGFRPRAGVQPFQNLANPIGNVLRQYHYILESGSTLLTLVEGGDIYHVVDATTVHGPILSISGMTEFGFTQVGTRAYISPAYTNGDGHQVGMPNEIIYVYKGDGTAARAAAGTPPVSTAATNAQSFVAFNSSSIGTVTANAHVIGVAYRAGGVDGIVGPEVKPVVIAPGNRQIQLVQIPIGPGGTTDRIIVMSKAIDLQSYNPATPPTLYEVTRINDNTTTSYLINTADASLTVVYVPGAVAAPVTSALRAVQSSTNGHTDRGFRIIAVVFETDTGYLTKPGPQTFAGVTTINNTKSIDVSGIPTGGSTVTKRHLLATRVIPTYNGDQTGFQFFYIPDGTINDNTTTTKNVSFYDSELIEDASHLLYNLDTIPAGVVLSQMHQRMVSVAEDGNISLARLSQPGEPEAFSELDGFILVPPNGKPLTNAQEFRDVLYLFQLTRTIAYTDNDEEPASWPDVILDQGVGTHNHGIATVLDSGGVNVDYLLIADLSGVFIFNGAYVRPEFTFKVNDLWIEQDRTQFYRIQMVNDSVNKILYIVLTDGTMLVGDYSHGLTPKDVIWQPWSFYFLIRSIILMNIDTLVIGAFEAAP